MTTEATKLSEVAALLSEQMIAALEDGLADPNGWTPPWHTSGFMAGAVNAKTKTHYRGGNAVWLGLLEALGAAVGPWATYKQWKALGAQVRKGEKATPVIRPVPIEKKDEETGEVKRFVIFRGYSVFHAGQVDGYEPEAREVTVSEEDRIARADAWIEAFGDEADLRFVDAPRAFYAPGGDYLQVPPMDACKTATGFYSTLFHEATHWTGHESRLDRGLDKGSQFGTPEYAREELVAELGSAILGVEFGLATELREDHRDYLANWLVVLKSDPSFVWEAATKAQKAATLLLGYEASEQEVAA